MYHTSSSMLMNDSTVGSISNEFPCALKAKPLLQNHDPKGTRTPFSSTLDFHSSGINLDDTHSPLYGQAPPYNGLENCASTNVHAGTPTTHSLGHSYLGGYTLDQIMVPSATIGGQHDLSYNFQTSGHHSHHDASLKDKYTRDISTNSSFNIAPFWPSHQDFVHAKFQEQTLQDQFIQPSDLDQSRPVVMNHKLIELINIYKMELKRLHPHIPDLPEFTTVDLNIDFILDKLLIAPEHLATDAADPMTQYFSNSLEHLKSWYFTEQKNLALICDQFAIWIKSTLQAPKQLNLVNSEDVRVKCGLMAAKFDRIRQDLYSFMVSTISMLYNIYGLNLRKRRQLPISATEVLSNWLDAHIDYPYPSETEKMELARMTSLSQVQINAWFGNRRIRDHRINTAKNAKSSLSIETSHDEMVESMITSASATEIESNSGLYFDPIRHDPSCLVHGVENTNYQSNHFLSHLEPTPCSPQSSFNQMLSITIN